MKKIFIFIFIIIAILLYNQNRSKINVDIFDKKEYKFMLHSYKKNTQGYKQYWFININVKTKKAEVFNHYIIEEGRENDKHYYTFKLTNSEIMEIEDLINDIKSNVEKYEYDDNKITSPVKYFEINIDGGDYIIVDMTKTKLLYSMIYSKEVMSNISEATGEKFPNFR